MPGVVVVPLTGKAMPEKFDPYHRWLAIPPEDQPANHYRLLALKEFEHDADVIESAADQRMAHLRTFQAGKHGELSQKLLNEVAAAKVCLLKTSKKAAYDAQLREQLAAEQPRAEVDEQADVPFCGVAVPAPAVRPIPVPRRRRTKAGPVIACGAVGLLLLAGLLVWTLRPDEEPVEQPGAVAQRPEEPPRAPPFAPERIEPSSVAPAEPDETPSDPSEPAVQPDPEPPAVAAVRRLSLPSQQAQAEVVGQLEEVYDFSRATAATAKIAMAERLLELGKQTEGNPAERFVLLRKAMDLAGEGRNAALMLDAVDAIAAGFEVDALAVQQSVLLKFAKSATDSTTLGSLVESALPVVDAALAAGRCDVALSLIDAAYRACQRPQGRDYRKQVYDRRKEVQQLHAVWQEFQAALATLKATPDDAEANLTAGRWYCFRHDDWQQGLPFLAKCSDEQLSAGAGRELADPTEATEQIAVADTWWDAAQTAKDETRAALMHRAGFWYQQAQPNVTSALLKTKLAARQQEIANVGQSMAGAPVSPVPDPDTVQPPAAADEHLTRGQSFSGAYSFDSSSAVGSTEAEVELVVVQPRNIGGYAFSHELLG